MLASAGAAPLVGALYKTLYDYKQDEKVDHDLMESLEFHLFDNNLLNLHFYLLNLKKESKFLIPGDPKKKSFIIVRLPQQHISEEGLTAGEIKANPRYAEARMSGYSFLAFELWPDAKEGTPLKKFKFSFSVESLLNWNDSTVMRLVTLTEWLKLNSLDQMEFVPCDQIKAKEFKTDDATDAVVPVTEFMQPSSLIYKRYKRMVTQLMGKPEFTPVTILEIPNKLYITPLFRTTGPQGQRKAETRFFPNAGLLDADRVGESKYEVWNTKMWYESTQDISVQKPGENKPQQYKIELPYFRIVGYGLGDNSEAPPDIAAICNNQRADPCATPPSDKFLPNLLTRVELTFLTQYAKSGTNDFLGQDFDLREMNGFFFTGLGIVCHLKYYNLENRPVGHNLIEYEHIITQGRDIFVKVSRLGVNSRTGQRYKYVQEGKRKIDDQGSFIELKEYCECIDKSIDYTLNGALDPKEFYTVKDHWRGFVTDEPANACLDQVVAVRRYPFNRKLVTEKERVPIYRLVKSVAGEEMVVDFTAPDCGWFWPVREDSTKPATPTTKGDLGKDLQVNQYLLCELDEEGSEDKENLKLKVRPFPFMFIYASVFENASPKFDDIYDSAHRKDFPGFADRRNIVFSGAKVAYTEALPAEAKSKGNDSPTVNKTNILETDFIEPYFNVRRVYPDKIENHLYPLYPQLLKARVYVDHIRDLTNEKISSIMEYHCDFVANGFAAFDGAKYLNGAKVILKNTDAFMKVKGTEETVNATYERIKVALQEAKSKLGNVAVPDVIPDTLSLEKFGIALPTDILNNPGIITNMGELTNIDPRQLLRGKFAEILGGIDLNAILTQLIPAADAPLFEIAKIANQLSNEVTASPVYQEIQSDLANTKAAVDNLLNVYNTAVATVAQKEKELNQAITSLYLIVPNETELRAILKTEFEMARIRAFAILDSTVNFDGVKAAIISAGANATQFYSNEVNVLSDDLQRAKKELGDMQTDIAVRFAKLPADVQKVLSPTPFDPVLDIIKLYTDAIAALTGLNANPPVGTLVSLRDRILKTATEISVAGLYYDIDTLELSTSPAAPQIIPVTTVTIRLNAGPPPEPILDFSYLQWSSRVDLIRSLIQKNAGDKNWETQVKTLTDELTTKLDQAVDGTSVSEHFSKMMADYQDTIEGYINSIRTWDARVRNLQSYPPDVLDAIAAIADRVVKLTPYLDLLRKLDPYFYYNEYLKLKKDVKDFRGRFQQEVLTEYDKLKGKIATEASNYNKAVEDFLRNRVLTDLAAAKKTTLDNLNSIAMTAIGNLVAADTKTKKLYDDIYGTQGLITQLDDAKKKITAAYSDYVAYAKSEVGALEEGITGTITTYINKKQQEIADGIGTDNLAKIDEARNLLQLLLAIRQQEITYRWNTNSFQDVNLGMITFRKFSNPDTSLAVNVKAVTYFTQGKFPPAIERVSTYAENRFSNFGIGFFGILTVNFSEVSFITGSEAGTHFDVKIKDVKFDGALSFVQAFEAWLKTIGKGLIMDLESDHVALGYSFPIPAVKTPAFSFFNLSLNFDLRIHFDRRPMRFGFSLATVERKFGIAAGIFAGFGFFSIVAEPKKGIVEIDTALEAGAWAGITIGPIVGEVKLAFGFRYTKTETSVRLEGYIVAEGRLSVWIIEVSARIYLGVVSENSYVEGACTVTYSAKMGFISASFSGTFRKKIAGAEKQNNDAAAAELVTSYRELAKVIQPSVKLAIHLNAMDHHKSFLSHLDSLDQEGTPSIETLPVSKERWREFINVF